MTHSINDYKVNHLQTDQYQNIDNKTHQYQSKFYANERIYSPKLEKSETRQIDFRKSGQNNYNGTQIHS